MKRIILLLLLFSATASAQYNIKPSKVNDGTTLAGKFSIQRSTQYRWSVNCLGTVNANLGVRVTFQGQTTAVLPLLTIATVGLTQLTATTSGDSLMMWWLPDDAGSAGTAGDVFKSISGWLGEVVVVGTAGSSGQIAVADAVTLPSLAAVPENDYLLKADSLLAAHGYATRTFVYDWVASHGGGSLTPQSIRDTLDIETSIGARLARRIKDSLDANPRAAIFDTTRIMNVPHKYTARQNYTGIDFDPAGYGKGTDDTARARVLQILPPNVDATAGPNRTGQGFGIMSNHIQQIAPGVFLNPYTRKYSHSLSIGMNPNGIFGIGDSLHWGVWDKYEDYYDDGYAWNFGRIWERHLEALGKNGVTTRLQTWYGALSTGRMLSGEMAFDGLLFVNGNGVSPASTDSILMGFNAPKSIGASYYPGSVGMYRNILRWTNGFLGGTMVAAAQEDSAGECSILRMNTGGVLQIGYNVLPSDASQIQGVRMTARQVDIFADSPNSRVSISGANQFRSSASTFRDADSTAVATKNYVDVKAAGGSGVSLATLTDSLASERMRQSAHADSNTVDRASVKSHIANTSNPHSITMNQVAPTQTGNAGKFLTTDGSNTSWAAAGGGSVDTTRLLPVGGSNKSASGTLDITGVGSAMKTDSLVNGYRSQDTLRTRVGSAADTVAYIRTGGMPPIAVPRQFPDAAGALKMGYEDFTFAWGFANSAMINIRTDSAQDIRISCIRFEIVAGADWGNSTDANENGSYGVWILYPSAGWVWTGTKESVGTTFTGGVRAAAFGTYKQCNAELWNVTSNSPEYALITMRVYYRMPIANASSTPIRLVGM